jgi:AraC family transcriptional regulator
MSDRNIFVETKPLSEERAGGAALRLRAGRGFETRGQTCDVAGFILVDAWLPPGLRAPLHAHARAYLTLILKGGFDENFGSHALSATAGTITVVPRGMPHRTTSHGARFLRMEVPDAVLELAAPRGATLQQPAILTQPTSITLARRIGLELRARHNGWTLVVHGLLLELLALVVRDTMPTTRGEPRWLRDVKARLDDDWRRLVSLSDLARPAGVHPMHLARSFRAAYGTSIGEYRRARQLQAAQEQLLRSRADLLAVALACGFSDQSHFTKAFRRAHGVTPGEYRRSQGDSRRR